MIFSSNQAWLAFLWGHFWAVHSVEPSVASPRKNMGLFEHRVPIKCLWVTPKSHGFIMIFVKASAGNIAHSRIVFNDRLRLFALDKNCTLNPIRLSCDTWYLPGTLWKCIWRMKPYSRWTVWFDSCTAKLQLDHHKSQIIKKHGKTVILSDIILL